MQYIDNFQDRSQISDLKPANWVSVPIKFCRLRIDNHPDKPKDFVPLDCDTQLKSLKLYWGGNNIDVSQMLIASNVHDTQIFGPYTFKKLSHCNP